MLDREGYCWKVVARRGLKHFCEKLLLFSEEIGPARGLRGGWRASGGWRKLQSAWKLYSSVCPRERKSGGREIQEAYS